MGGAAVVVTYVPVDLSICRHCVYLGASAGIKLREAAWPRESADLTRLVSALLRAGLRVVVVDAFTLRGLWLMLRYRSGKLPLVIINGVKAHSGPLGGDPEGLAARLVTLAKLDVVQHGEVT
ncbi:MAG: hypothetical protein ACK4SY_09395 [Pyrobaculum sp.]